jgi:HlyD family secretion protein
MRKAYLVIGIGVVAIAALVLVFPRLSQSGVVSAQNFQTALVERVTLTTTIESTGTIAAEQTLSLSFGTAGVVREVDVQVGAEVSVGQVLAQLETADLEYQIALLEQALIVQQAAYDELIAEPTAQQIAQAEANLAAAQSQLQSAQSSLAGASNQQVITCAGLEDAQLRLEQAQEDYDQYVTQGYEADATFMPDPESAAGTALREAQNTFNVQQAQCANTPPTSNYEAQVTAAQASVEQAQAALDALLAGASEEDITAAEARLEQARLELENARTSLDDAVITAPFAGIVADVNIVAGQTVNASAAVITLLDSSILHIDVSVDELDIAQVAVGQNALITPEALNDTTLDGVVSRIAPIGESSEGIVTYNVRVDLVDVDELSVRVGMTTDVEIIVATTENVLAVPTQAIQRDGETEFVQVLNDDGTTVNVPVITGQSSGDMTAVEGDLIEGTLVVIPADESQQNNSGFNGPFGG